MELVWILGHQVIEGNEKADICVVIGLSLDEIMTCSDDQTNLVVVANKLDD